MEGISWLQAISLLGLIAALGGIAKIFMWVGRIDAMRDSVTDFMKEIRSDIKKILGNMEPRTVVAGSPLQLSDLGEQIADTLSVRPWAHVMSSGILLDETYDNVREMSEYELQEFCMNYCTSVFSFPEETLDRMANVAFNHGIKVKEVKKVYAVLLRDQIREKRNRTTTVETITDDDIPF